MADFSLASMPNFASAALSGYQAGAALGRQQRLDGALSAVDLTRPETIVPVLQSDPQTGAALLGASQTMAKAHADAASRHALASVILGSRPGGGDQSTEAPAAPAAAANAAATALTPSSPDDIVVMAPHKPAPTGPVWTDAERAAIEADPDAFLKAQGGLSKLNETHLAAVNDAANAQAAVSLEASKLPYDQRKAYIAGQAPYLMQHNVTQAQIDAFDPTDSNLNTLQTQALGVKETLAQRDKDRSFALSQEKFVEDKRHTGVEESQGAQRIGLEGANVAISRGNLAISQHREARETSTGGGGSGSVTSAPRYEYRIVNGVTQRRLVK